MAASNTIKVTTSQLTSTANSLRDTGNNIKTVTNDMGQVIQQLTGSVWSGDAADAFKKKYAELSDDINRMISMINEHVTDLNTIAKAYQDAETTSINAANALAGDIIS